jgi:hypothetical protein
MISLDRLKKFIIILCTVLVVSEIYQSSQGMYAVNSTSSQLLSSACVGFVNRPAAREAGASVITGSSGFDKAAYNTFKDIVQEQSAKIKLGMKRQNFDLSAWDKQTNGGLQDADRILLAKLYRQADSVFEYGLGESTYIADHVGVPKYAGIDSDVIWVDQTRKKVSPHFRFYYGDTGTTGEWGMPEQIDLTKNVWQYQLAPLEAELEPFDVYMVDGRYRVPCVLLSFLHASARGANHQDTIVLMHDCNQPGYSPSNLERDHIGYRNYTVNDDILDLVDHSRDRLCVYKRRKTTTDDMLLERYEKYKYNIG